MIIHTIEGDKTYDFDYHPIGYSFNCPTCQSKKTLCLASLSEEYKFPMWMCTECACYFTCFDVR